MLHISIPRYRRIDPSVTNQLFSDPASFSKHDKRFTAFEVHVSGTGILHHVVERRFRQFESLHHKLKKLGHSNKFPPKHLLHRSPAALNERRVLLQEYLRQSVKIDPVPMEVFEFLGLTNSGSSDLWRSSGMSTCSSAGDSSSETSSTCSLSHHPVVMWPRDPFVLETAPGPLPDIILDGTEMEFS